MAKRVHALGPTTSEGDGVSPEWPPPPTPGTPKAGRGFDQETASGADADADAASELPPLAHIPVVPALDLSAAGGGTSDAAAWPAASQRSVPSSPIVLGGAVRLETLEDLRRQAAEMSNGGVSLHGRALMWPLMSTPPSIRGRDAVREAARGRNPHAASVVPSGGKAWRSRNLPSASKWQEQRHKSLKKAARKAGGSPPRKKEPPPASPTGSFGSRPGSPMSRPRTRGAALGSPTSRPGTAGSALAPPQKSIVERLVKGVDKPPKVMHMPEPLTLDAGGSLDPARFVYSVTSLPESLMSSPPRRRRRGRKGARAPAQPKPSMLFSPMGGSSFLDHVPSHRAARNLRLGRVPKNKDKFGEWMFTGALPDSARLMNGHLNAPEHVWQPKPKPKPTILLDPAPSELPASLQADSALGRLDEDGEADDSDDADGSAVVVDGDHGGAGDLGLLPGSSGARRPPCLSGPGARDIELLAPESDSEEEAVHDAEKREMAHEMHKSRRSMRRRASQGLLSFVEEKELEEKPLHVNDEPPRKPLPNGGLQRQMTAEVSSMFGDAAAGGARNTEDAAGKSMRRGSRSSSDGSHSSGALHRRGSVDEVIRREAHAKYPKAIFPILTLTKEGLPVFDLKHSPRHYMERRHSRKFSAADIEDTLALGMAATVNHDEKAAHEVHVHHKRDRSRRAADHLKGVWGRFVDHYSKQKHDAFMHWRVVTGA